MKQIIVNTANQFYSQVTADRGPDGLGRPVFGRVADDPDSIVVYRDVIQQKLTAIRALKTEFQNYTGYNFNRIDTQYGNDTDEKAVAFYFKKRMIEILFGNNPPASAEGKRGGSWFNAWSVTYDVVGKNRFQSRDNAVRIMNDWIILLNDILDYKSGLAEEVPLPPTPPEPTPVPTWRNCITGQLESTPIPTDWMYSIYTGPEGGFCREPVFISVQSSSVAFTYNTFTQQNPIPVTYTLTNTSENIAYSLNLATDSVFTINPNSIDLNPQESKTVTVTIPSQNINNFLPGTTNLRLQMNVVKL